MKRVLFLKQEILPKGGLEKYAKKIVSAFLDYGCDVSIVSSTPNISEFGGAKVQYLPLNGFLHFQKLKSWDLSTQAYVQNHSHDIAFTLDRITSATHIRAGNGVHAAYLKQRQEGILKRFSFSINPLHRTLLRFEKKGFESPHLRKIIVNSHMVKEELRSFYDVPSERVAVHHNGMEWHEMAYDFSHWKHTRKSMQNELGLEPGLPVFLFVGHHYQRKGLDYLLSGLSLLREGHLIIIGKEKHFQRYQSLVRNLGIGNRVRFLGPRSDIRRFYALADALVIPSLYDPFANVTVEALGMGLYVVSSKFNGGKEILDKECGCVIDDLFDPESVAKALEQSLFFPKTLESAEETRAKVSFMDFSIALPRLVEECLSDC
jgi:UDP-glucose:(heptosyl)LPS alpha-1,3-glucosyltransferase